MDSTNTPNLDIALQGISPKFRKRLKETFFEVKKRHLQAEYSSNWDSSGLSAGKFCETVLRFLQHELTGEYTPFGQHIKNFPDECGKLLQLPKTSGLESLRVIMPRALIFIYTLRGKRGVGHVGGDVEANKIDIATIAKVCDWVFCELIRIYHGLSLENAQALVDNLSLREIPLVWEISGKKRILNKGLNYKKKVLLLLYSSITENGVLTEDLHDWSEHSHLSYFKRDVLKPLHKDKLVEYDQSNEIVYISPLGITEAENVLKEELNEG